ncbi:AraC family transcriptional regulator [Ethanoligenens harbinense]|uniref:Transcriptional regulator, AraC family n=1 Tax=Ethanoligenens harbinense (strain DSM 18485 / JCM 12961 / CGMCC 1.5033 / YUAN-3) TaxID=663278 RepID=E6U9M0_ETHHY|nr:AraC family transcriptional regulator [Ethanoligenens harbinense]ADU27306.1 transcriptional regulator, AraC family [Ethanoligenens harbinense YUAN-3]AVQ96371.1 AraC family transcriptional regulator [Ethanoligenens harbinense YUAN-3]AYF39029.1 AraC family transcriptional regulator [Ethanoligenens harbinense]AYF41855.1 AraC family transcriptional regulator [Ethanoligenens harbinense]QCN92612.1 AraC family transcriptional regulator [Ethanoligenens harbinense]
MGTSIKDYYLAPGEPSPLGIQVLHAGEQNCPPGHCFGYAIRTHYLLHYVVNGCGEYRVNHKTYLLKEGDGFLILPGASTFYKAADTDPWIYRWVGFNGKSAKKILNDVGLNENCLLFHCEMDDYINNCLIYLKESCQIASGNDLVRTGYLLLILGKLKGQRVLAESESHEGKNNRFHNASKYIQSNYMRNIKITDISNFVGVDRSQLYRIFQETVHLSPKEYLNNYRLDCAGILIHTTDMSFNEIASSVGFEYSSHFSKLFKEHFGITPSEYKRRNN